jgi:very-short-patch-repair endonuclease
MGEGMLQAMDTAWQRANDRGDQRPTARARQLRNNATEPERRLWQALRSRQVLGVRFNRQFPVGPYICDFVSREYRLVIEIDGATHAQSEDHDRRRTAFLKSQGLRVVRFCNGDVMNNLDGVVLELVRILKELGVAGEL